jgi:hypothetical protein
MNESAIKVKSTSWTTPGHSFVLVWSVPSAAVVRGSEQGSDLSFPQDKSARTYISVGTVPPILPPRTRKFKSVSLPLPQTKSNKHVRRSDDPWKTGTRRRWTYISVGMIPSIPPSRSPSRSRYVKLVSLPLPQNKSKKHVRRSDDYPGKQERAVVGLTFPSEWYHQYPPWRSRYVK